MAFNSGNGVGIKLFVFGIFVIFLYYLYFLFEGIFMVFLDSGIPVFVRVAVVAMILGLIIALFELIFERIKDSGEEDKVFKKDKI